MLEEEPSARVERSATGEQLLIATGEAHIAVIGERLKRKFGAAIVTKTPKIPYKETIRGTTKVEGRYKKQTGGHGMFGHVWLEIEPNPGGGVEFAEHIVGGSVPKGFFPGVEKGIREAAAEGVLAGYPLSDFKATLFDGSFHTVDSNELSFKIAASMALKKGVMDCKPGLLEPIMNVEVRVPEEYMGDVNRDLNTRRGRLLGMDSSDGMQIVSAQVPQAELFTYATELRSLTHGRGTFTAELDHYEEVPSHIAEKVIDAHKKETETPAATDRDLACYATHRCRPGPSVALDHLRSSDTARARLRLPVEPSEPDLRQSQGTDPGAFGRAARRRIVARPRVRPTPDARGVHRVRARPAACGFGRHERARFAGMSGVHEFLLTALGDGSATRVDAVADGRGGWLRWGPIVRASQRAAWRRMRSEMASSA
jgi:hypothetical protein